MLLRLFIRYDQWRLNLIILTLINFLDATWLWKECYLFRIGFVGHPRSLPVLLRIVETDVIKLGGEDFRLKLTSSYEGFELFINDTVFTVVATVSLQTRTRWFQSQLIELAFPVDVSFVDLKLSVEVLEEVNISAFLICQPNTVWIDVNRFTICSEAVLVKLDTWMHGLKRTIYFLVLVKCPWHTVEGVLSKVTITAQVEIISNPSYKNYQVLALDVLPFKSLTSFVKLIKLWDYLCLTQISVNFRIIYAEELKEVLSLVNTPIAVFEIERASVAENNADWFGSYVGRIRYVNLKFLHRFLFWLF